MGQVDDLQRDIRERRIVVITGSGVSSAAVNSEIDLSWVGLLENGINYANEINPNLPSGWAELTMKDLWLARDGYDDNFAIVAEKVKVALDAKGSASFSRWVSKYFSNLKVKESSLIKSIVDLDVPLLTTNYDSSIESVTDLDTVTWMVPTAIQMVLQGKDRAVVHLHGHWRTPASIVFGSTSYGEIAGTATVEALSHAMVMLQSVMFIGMGAGTNDPQFRALRRWLTSILPTSEHQHYHLCRESELTSLSAEYQNEQIIPIPYGKEFTNLPVFLQSLASGRTSGNLELYPTESNLRTRAIEAIADRVRTEALLSDHFHNIDQLTVEQVLIPPVILPMTHEQFASSLDLPENQRPRRSDIRSDVRQYKQLVLASGEGIGLTSALEWLVLDAANHHTGALPVLIDFRRLGQGHRPLEREIRRELMSSGAMNDLRADLPVCLVALDNVNPLTGKIIRRAIQELWELPIEFAVLGCRIGAEVELVNQLQSQGMRPEIRYLGRLNGGDIARMVGLVDPTRTTAICRAVIQVANTQHLARTPMTVGLLISVLLQGESLLATASETALLDAYVNLLLGRGDPHDDARFDLDSMERVDILRTLAGRYVDLDSGSLSEAKVLDELDRYFREVGWTEDPLAVLNNLVRRHVLVIRSGQVSFTQTSFLHLFAAKRAIGDREFREFLYKRPLYYAPILKHYAALTRDDAEVLRNIEALLTPAGEADAGKGHFFVLDESTEKSNGTVTSVDELLQRLSIPALDQAGGSSSNEPDAEPVSVDWLDTLSDSDSLPFPVEPIEDAPLAVQVFSALALVSTVLRDSELVRDNKLKQRVLLRTLIVWARFVEILDADDAFKSFLNGAAEGLADTLGISGSKRKDFVDQLVEFGPILTGYGGISQTLSSRKLLRSLDACFENESLLSDAGGAVMGALLGFDIQSPGWSKYFHAIQDRYGRRLTTRTFLRRFALLSFYFQGLSEVDEKGIHDFLADQFCGDVAYSSDAERKSARSQISQKLRKNRVLFRKKQLPLGDTVFQDNQASEELK